MSSISLCRAAILEVTHPRTNSSLGWSTSEFIWDPVLHPGRLCFLISHLNTTKNTPNKWSIFWCSSCEDEKSRAGLLHYLLKHLDPYVSSSVEHQRQRACCTVLALLKQFHALPAICSSPIGCTVNSLQLRASGEEGQSSNAGSPYSLIEMFWFVVTIVVSSTSPLNKWMCAD
jgi:hypothetical protein